MEIVVSDNSSTPNTRELVESMRSSRIKYVRPNKPLSMAHNFEFGISHATGDWIAVLGDDDGLLPGGIRKALSWIVPSGQKSLCSDTGLYYWPSAVDSRMPVLQVPWRRGLEVRDAQSARQAVLLGNCDYRSLPILYTGGLVHTSLLNRMRPDGGPVIRSQIPDVYSGFAITSVDNSFLFSHEPFAIGGLSNHSTGLQTLLRFAGALAPFHSDDLIAFHPSIPLPKAGTLTFSLEALQFESYLQSAFLRTGEAMMNAGRQIDVILGRLPPRYRPNLIEWVKAYAIMHGLDAQEIQRREHSLAGHFRRQRLKSGLRNSLCHVRQFAGDSPALENIYDACVRANQMLEGKISVLWSHARYAKLLLHKKIVPKHEVQA